MWAYYFKLQCVELRQCRYLPLNAVYCSSRAATLQFASGLTIPSQSGERDG